MKGLLRILLCALPLLAASATAKAAETAVAKPARVVTSVVKSGAIVEAVNKETRELKLLDADGNRTTVVVEDEVRNFDQIEPRDRLVIEYLESIAIVIAPEGSQAPVGNAAELTTAPAGAKPGMEGAKTEVEVATVRAINAAERLVTVETEDGEQRTITAREDAPLDMVEVGDQVRLRVTRAMVITIEAPDPG